VNGRRSGFRRELSTHAAAALAIAGAALLALVFAQFAPVATSSTAPAAEPVRRLSEGRFIVGAAKPVGGDGRPQSLPHDWSVTDAELKGDAWYALPVAFPAVPRALQALYLTAITSPAEVYVNGELVGATGPLDGRRPRSYEQSQLYSLPGDVLRAGDNLVLVHVRAKNGGAGVGPVLVGERSVLRRMALWDLVVHTLAPAAIAVVNVTVGVFLSFLWVRRRDPSYVGLFAVAAILWGVHTGVTLVPETLIPQPHFFIWWHGVYLTFVALLCVFCVRFAGHRWPRYERFALVYAALVVPLLYLSLVLSIEGELSSWIRLGGIALVIYALYGVGLYVVRNRSTESRLLLVTGVVSAVFAVHDWLDARNPDIVRPVYLVPYAALAFLLFVGWMLVDRFVRALNEAERLNVHLEARVAEKSALLSAQLAETERAREAAETANLAKSRFLAAASHDLRQPLHAIGLFASALAEQSRNAEDIALVQRIQTSVESLEALFSSLLDVSRLEAGAVVARIADVPANALLDRIAHDFAPVALERGLSLSVVPSTAWLATDALLLDRIVGNLVSNALRYTERGGVVVGCRPRGSHCTIEVWDTGRGIPVEERDRIFEEFYRSDGHEPSAHGLGLGLAIVRRLAALLGHDVDFDSTPGRGSVFRVHLPRGRPRVIEAPAPMAATDTLAGRQVLVVEDEAPVRDGMERLLRTWKCEAVVVGDASAALQALADGMRPDMLIVDYRLANGGSGLQAIARIREAAGRDIPALIVSGESHPEELARIKASGFHIVHKPVPPARLRSVVAWLLTRDREAA